MGDKATYTDIQDVFNIIQLKLLKTHFPNKNRTVQ